MYLLYICKFFKNSNIHNLIHIITLWTELQRIIISIFRYNANKKVDFRMYTNAIKCEQLSAKLYN